MTGDPCGCGSGLRAARCCGLDLATLAPAEASRPLAGLIATALAGNGATAERACLDVLELVPGEVDVLWVLACRREAGGVAAAAEALLARIVAINPNHVAATHALGLRLLRRGAVAAAEVHARNGVRIAPGAAQSHYLLGMVLTEAHQPQIGDVHYRRALVLAEGRDPILIANLAWCLKLQGRIDEARVLYAESLAGAPGVFQTLLGWARLEEADRQFDVALGLIEQAEAVSPGHPSLRLLRAVIAGRRGDTARALAMLAPLDAGSGLGPDELMEQGRLLDRAGRHADAFAAFDAGRALLRAMGGLDYQAEAAAALAGRLRGFFTAARVATLPRAEVREDAPQPVFIVGFPRSGTTLVEQMLSAHPAVAAGDELPFVGELAGLVPRLLGSPLPYPEALSELWMADRSRGLDGLRDTYLQRADQYGLRGGKARLFTDKMPLNETHLGLIGLVFPAAPIVHVVRHPLDVVLSVYSNLLTHGFHCASALETAARHYVLVSELVAQYRAEMRLRCLELRYETLVAEPAASVRGMLEFLGLDYDESCLRFEENRRYARTASYAQVTEPLYRRSVGRWRQYRTQLAPAMPILQPVMERLGYAQ